MFILLLICCVLEVVTTVATSPYHVYCIVVPSKVFDRRLILDLDYCAETDFLLSRIWVKFSVGNSENYANLRE